MKFSHAIMTLYEDGYLWDIGQLNKGLRQYFTRLARKGLIVKSRAMWPWFTHGTIEKTIYTTTGKE